MHSARYSCSIVTQVEFSRKILVEVTDV